MEKSLEGHQLNIQVVDLQRAEGISPPSVAIAVAIVSAMLDRPVTAGVIVLGPGKDSVGKAASKGGDQACRSGGCPRRGESP